MKPIIAILTSTFISLTCIGTVLGQNTSIMIDQITANDQITGYVIDLDEGTYKDYKVLVYLHTDQWYIHPYAGQGVGLSWATIEENGEWSIETVQRKFKADKMAVIVIDKDYPEPSKIEQIERIPSVAIKIRQLRGTDDFGKL